MTLQKFKNDLFSVEAKYIDSEVLFDVESIAVSLGLTQNKGGNEYVRWERVNGFLNVSPIVGKGSLITESMVYTLAFKASNETALKFQMWLSTEVLPSIRKHGAYMTEQTLERTVADPDFLIGLLTNLKQEQQARKELEVKVEEQKPKVAFAEAVEFSDGSVSMKDLAVIITQNGYKIGRNTLFEWMRSRGYIEKNTTKPIQRYVEKGLFECTETLIKRSSGKDEIRVTTRITGKGQIYFVNKFLKQ